MNIYDKFLTETKEVNDILERRDELARRTITHMINRKDVTDKEKQALADLENQVTKDKQRLIELVKTCPTEVK